MINDSNHYVGSNVGSNQVDGVTEEVLFFSTLTPIAQFVYCTPALRFVR